ncbi:MAG: hypothetical protein RJA87_1307 [Pseudomonadota bacterium]
MRITQRTDAYLRESIDGLQLLATRRAGTDEPFQFPPQEYIHGTNEVVELPIGPTGVLYSFTVVHPGRDKQSYALAMVDFAPGLRVFGKLLLASDAQLALGSTVRLVPYQLPDGEPDYAFAPLEGGAS